MKILAQLLFSFIYALLLLAAVSLLLLIVVAFPLGNSAEFGAAAARFVFEKFWFVQLGATATVFAYIVISLSRLQQQSHGEN